MQLFGLPGTMDGKLQRFWQKQTQRYLEEFYDNNPHGGGLLDVIKEGVNNVSAKVRIQNQSIEYGYGTGGDPIDSPSPGVTEPCAGSDPCM